MMTRVTMCDNLCPDVWVHVTTMMVAIHLAIRSILVVKEVVTLWEVQNCVTVITIVVVQVNLPQSYVLMVWENVTIVANCNDKCIAKHPGGQGTCDGYPKSFCQCIYYC